VGAKKSVLFLAPVSFINEQLTNNVQFWLTHSVKFLLCNNFVSYKYINVLFTLVLFSYLRATRSFSSDVILFQKFVSNFWYSLQLIFWDFLNEWHHYHKISVHSLNSSLEEDISSSVNVFCDVWLSVAGGCLKQFKTFCFKLPQTLFAAVWVQSFCNVYFLVQCSVPYLPEYKTIQLQSSLVRKIPAQNIRNCATL
jgi:hypothetical protein